MNTVTAEGTLRDRRVCVQNLSLTHTVPLPVFILLHWIFVAGSTLPAGCMDEFLRATARANQRNASITHASAAAKLHQYRTAAKQVIQQESSTNSRWSTEGSDRYARCRISLTQRDVARTLQRHEILESLAEADSTNSFAGAVKAQAVSLSEIARMLRLPSSRRFSQAERAPQTELQLEDAQLQEGGLESDDSELEALMRFHAWSQKANSKLGIERGRKTGTKPKEVRATLRHKLQLVLLFSYAGKKAIKTLHRLKQCCIFSGMDLMTYAYFGSSMPDVGRYEVVCKRCVRSRCLRSSSAPIPLLRVRTMGDDDSHIPCGTGHHIARAAKTLAQQLLVV